jgi:hypothetical protein
MGVGAFKEVAGAAVMVAAMATSASAAGAGIITAAIPAAAGE